MAFFPFFSKTKSGGPVFIPPPGPTNWWELPGVPSPMIAYQPRGAATYAASLINLAEPGVHNASTMGVAPLWNNVDGWLLDKGPALKCGTQTVALGDTVIVQYTGWKPDLFRILIGAWATHGMIIGQPITDPAGYVYFNSAFVPAGTLPTPSGNACIAGAKGYSDGVFNVNLTTDGYDAAAMGIGDGNAAGSAVGRPGYFRCQSYGHYFGTLNATQIATVASGMLAMLRNSVAGINLVGHSIGRTSVNTATSLEIDSTSADLLIAAVAYQGNLGITPTVTDSKGNTWNALTNTGAVVTGLRMFWSKPTTVGTAHTASFTNATASYPVISFAAFSGTNASPFDQQALTTGSDSPGSLTPAVANSLVVSVVSASQPVHYSVDSSFMISDQQIIVGGTNYGHAMAWKIQTGAVNPAWSVGGVDRSVAMAIFKP